MSMVGTCYHDQLRDVDNIVEAREGDAHKNHSSVLVFPLIDQLSLEGALMIGFPLDDSLMIGFA